MFDRDGIHDEKSIERGDLKGKPQVAGEGSLRGQERNLVDVVRVLSKIVESQAADIT
jgi:hypothetical protein